MFAIIKEAGKQYVAVPGRTITLDKKLAEKGGRVAFEEVLLVSSGGKVTVGTPLVDGAKVIGTVARQGRGRKTIVFKYKPKKRYRKKQGHRQDFTQVKIEKIEMQTQRRESRDKSQEEKIKTEAA